MNISTYTPTKGVVALARAAFATAALCCICLVSHADIAWVYTPGGPVTVSVTTSGGYVFDDATGACLGSLGANGCVYANGVVVAVLAQ